MADRDFGKVKTVVASAVKNATFNSGGQDIGPYNGYSYQVNITDAVVAADAVTAITGTAEVTTLTFPAKAAAAVGDYIAISDIDGDLWGIWLQKDPTGTAAVQTLTFPDEATADSGDYAVVKDTTGASWAASLQKLDIKTFTFPAVAAAGDGDYFVAYDTAGDGWAIALSKGEVKAVTTLTFPANAAASDGDFFVVYDEAGLEWAVSLDTSGSSPEPTSAVWTAVNAARKTHLDISATTDAASVAAAVELAFDALGSVTIVTDDTAADGTMTFTRADWGPVTATVVSDSTGAGAGSVSAAETTTGVALTTPTGAIWAGLAGANKDVLSISTLTDAASVAAAVEVAFDALSSGIVTDDSAADGTMTFTQAAIGAVSDGVVKDDDDAGAGTITVANTQTGREPTGAVWAAIDAANKIQVDITGASTAAGVAAAVEVGFDSLSSGIATDDTAADGTMTFTQAASGPVADVVPKDFDDSGAGNITAANTTPGVSPDSAPSGAVWATIDAAKKSACDISGETTAADVAAAAELALDALAGFTALIATDDTAADGTMTLTHASRGVVTDPVPKNEDDSGAGSITTAETTPGIDSKFDSTADTISITAHGFSTGAVFQLTTDGTLPTGLALATDYYAIVVDANTLKLASSFNNALAGTAVDFTDDGTAAQTATLTPEALSLSLAVEGSLDGVNWSVADAALTTAVTDNTSKLFNVTDAQYPKSRINVTWTSGVAKVEILHFAKQ